MRRRWEIRQRLGDGSVYEVPIRKCWTLKGAAVELDILEAERLNKEFSDWAFFIWDNVNEVPVVFS